MADPGPVNPPPGMTWPSASAANWQQVDPASGSGSRSGHENDEQFDDYVDPVDELREHFTKFGGGAQQRWEFDTVVGSGAFGVAVRMKRKSRWGRLPRRVIVKRALDDPGDLRDEIKWLLKTRGAEHIVNILAFRDDPGKKPANNNGQGQGNQVWWRRAAGAVRDAFLTPQDPYSLVGLAGPVAVLEYLENGTLTRLTDRMTHLNVTLPNRVLWYMYLCMVRACIGLAYPSEGAPRLERIPNDGRAPEEIVHGDLHTSNMMLGDTDPSVAEHRLVPRVKFIDLGAARVSANGTQENLYTIAERMMMLIGAPERWGYHEMSQWNGYETFATDILPGTGGPTFPFLDEDLRDLLARSLAKEEGNRPNLQQTFQEVSDAVRTKTAASYAPDDARETDYHIRDVWRRLLHDADDEDDPPPRVKLAPLPAFGERSNPNLMPVEMGVPWF
ncbi:hypothetical protein F4778DRAFT_611877 [Xylariomycetidae sp. FL2044]|nr:hypothetical protein F4778DRAFT_611877 [Xylariomycetidae sp. FL2044]